MAFSATIRPSSRAAILRLCCGLVPLLTIAAACGARVPHPAPLATTPTRGFDTASVRHPATRLATATAPAREVVPVATLSAADLQPRVVVTPRATYVVISTGPVRIGTRTELSIAYVAASDPAAGSAPDAPERICSAAEAIFRAIQTLAEMTGTDEVSVLALFGAPGEAGIAQQITFNHGPDAWHASRTPVAAVVASMPALPIAVQRDDGGERAAVEVALRFLEEADRLDLDAAWDLSSAGFRATTSRAAFDAHLRALHGTPGDAPWVEQFHSFAPGAFVPGADLDVLFARPPRYEAVMLRMEDDRTWRVAGVLTLGPDHPPRADTSVTAAL